MNANTEESGQQTSAGAKGARVWDLPVRLFHWVLLAAVVTATATGLTGGLWQMVRRSSSRPRYQVIRKA